MKFLGVASRRPSLRRTKDFLAVCNLSFHDGFGARSIVLEVTGVVTETGSVFSFFFFCKNSK